VGFAALISCGGDSPTAPPAALPMKTLARVSVDATCSAYSQYPIHVTLISASTMYRTAEFTVWYNQQAIDVELPAGGAYRVFGWYGADLFHQQAQWDFSTNIGGNQTTAVALRCVRP